MVINTSAGGRSSDNDNRNHIIMVMEVKIYIILGKCEECVINSFHEGLTSSIDIASLFFLVLSYKYLSNNCTLEIIITSLSCRQKLKLYAPRFLSSVY